MAACQEKNGFNSFPFVLLLPPSSADWQSPGGKMNISFFFFLCLFLYLSFSSLLFFLFPSNLTNPQVEKLIISFFCFLCLFLYLSFFSLLFLLLLSTLKKPQMEKTYSNFFLFDFCHFSSLFFFLMLSKSPGGKIIISFLFALCHFLLVHLCFSFFCSANIQLLR